MISNNPFNKSFQSQDFHEKIESLGSKLMAGFDSKKNYIDKNFDVKEFFYYEGKPDAGIFSRLRHNVALLLSKIGFGSYAHSEINEIASRILKFDSFDGSRANDLKHIQSLENVLDKLASLTNNEEMRGNLKGRFENLKILEKHVSKSQEKSRIEEQEREVKEEPELKTVSEVRGFMGKIKLQAMKEDGLPVAKKMYQYLDFVINNEEEFKQFRSEAGALSIKLNILEKKTKTAEQLFGPKEEIKKENPVPIIVDEDEFTEVVDEESKKVAEWKDQLTDIAKSNKNVEVFLNKFDDLEKMLSEHTKYNKRQLLSAYNAMLDPYNKIYKLLQNNSLDAKVIPQVEKLTNSYNEIIKN